MYIRSMLNNSDKDHIKMMTARLKVMNAYLSKCPSPENTAFSTGGIVEIIPTMIPRHWVEKRVTAKVEPRNLPIKELVDHLENLENQDLANEIPSQKIRIGRRTLLLRLEMAVTSPTTAPPAATSAHCLRVKISVLGSPILHHNASQETIMKNY